MHLQGAIHICRHIHRIILEVVVWIFEQKCVVMSRIEDIDEVYEILLRSESNIICVSRLDR